MGERWIDDHFLFKFFKYYCLFKITDEEEREICCCSTYLHWLILVMCFDQRLKPKPWCIGIMFYPTELPNQVLWLVFKTQTNKGFPIYHSWAWCYQEGAATSTKSVAVWRGTLEEALNFSRGPQPQQAIRGINTSLFSQTLISRYFPLAECHLEPKDNGGCIQPMWWVPAR